MFLFEEEINSSSEDDEIFDHTHTSHNPLFVKEFLQVERELKMNACTSGRTLQVIAFVLLLILCNIFMFADDGDVIDYKLRESGTVTRCAMHAARTPSQPALFLM